MDIKMTMATMLNHNHIGLTPFHIGFSHALSYADSMKMRGLASKMGREY